MFLPPVLDQETRCVPVRFCVYICSVFSKTEKYMKTYTLIIRKTLKDDDDIINGHKIQIYKLFVLIN